MARGRQHITLPVGMSNIKQTPTLPIYRLTQSAIIPYEFIIKRRIKRSHRDHQRTEQIHPRL
ncbi:hypothetical protein AA106556_1847 [Neokomagataea tanensis NBRC 106556]|uniref:Transposase n=1 Tax=Neokomagataea tanensis NBRC 106556 TaxID=1223519 RepID=A0ABQ0QL20_9PROT|nr:hypothetical protein AA106556_1847 [Neokomagataea tanensis NBRC 106556]